MLAYAANRPRVGARQSSPNAMLFVICAHIIVIAVVLSTRMTMPPKVSNSPAPMISVPLPQAPPPRPVGTPTRPRAPTPSQVARAPEANDPMPTAVPMPLVPGTSDAKPLTGSVTIPYLPPLPSQPTGVTSGAALLTPPSDLKPPYPQAKLLTGEEASLTLRLSIDEQGRVIAVDPVGRFDPVFLASARGHILAHWRYKPAMKDGRPVASTTIVTLRFELDG